MQKRDSKKWCKNNQKWCPNGVKIDQKTTKRVVKNRCENRCKTAPSKGGSAVASLAPLVVLSRYTLLLVSQTHISTTNQTLKTALRHRYADARPDLWATASSADLRFCFLVPFGSLFGILWLTFGALWLHPGCDLHENRVFYTLFYRFWYTRHSMRGRLSLAT